MRKKSAQMLQCEHENDQNSSCGQHRGREGVHPTGAAGLVMEMTTLFMYEPKKSKRFSFFYNISNIFGKDIVFFLQDGLSEAGLTKLVLKFIETIGVNPLFNSICTFIEVIIFYDLIILFVEAVFALCVNVPSNFLHSKDI